MCSHQSTKTPQPDPLFVLHGHKHSVSSVCFMQIDDEDYLLSGSNEGELILWSLRNWRIEKRITIENLDMTDRITALISWSKAGNFLCQFKCGAIYCFALDEKKEIFCINKRIMGSHSATFCKCDLYFDAEDNIRPSLIAKPAETGGKLHPLIDVIEYVSEEKLCQVGSSLRDQQKYGVPMMLQFSKVTESNDVRFIFVAYENGSLILFAIKKVFTEFENKSKGENPICATNFVDQPLSELKCFDAEPITCFSFDKTTSTGLCGSINKSICVWTLNFDETNLQAHLTTKKLVAITNAGLNACSIRCDAKIFATAGYDSRIRLFSLKTLKPLAVLAVHEESIESVTFSLKLIKEVGFLLAAASKDKSISIWSPYNDS